MTHNSQVKSFKCTAYRLHPMIDTSDQSSSNPSSEAGAMDDEYFTLDGERVKCGPIQATILPAAARVKKLHVA